MTIRHKNYFSEWWTVECTAARIPWNECISTVQLCYSTNNGATMRWEEHFFKLMEFWGSQPLNAYPQKSCLSDTNGAFQEELNLFMSRRRKLAQSLASIQPRAQLQESNRMGMESCTKVDSMGHVEILFTNLARVHACNLVHKLRARHSAGLPSSFTYL